MKKNYHPMKHISFISLALLVTMLLWAPVASAQKQEQQTNDQGEFFTKIVELLNEMTDEEKKYARENMLVAPAPYVTHGDHPTSFIITPNPAPDTQTKVECAACSGAYLLRFYGEQADGVELYHSENFPCKYEGGAFPRCFKIFFEEQRKNYTTAYYTGTTDDLKDAVSKGIPVIALLLYNGKSMHYVPVVGYDESHFFIQNSVAKYRNVADNSSYNEKLDIATFDAMWNLPIESCQRLFVIVKKTK